jgi:cell division protein FtsB
MLFFDRYDLLNQYQFRKELKQLREERSYYIKEIKHNNEIMNALLNDTVALEKFAREKYLMKRDNEELFIIEDTLTSTSNGR